MSHRDYVAKRKLREPRFEAELEAAAAELALGEIIVHRRHERKLSLTQLMDRTGIPMERLEAIEEGDAMTLHEVLWLLHVLELSVSFDQDFHVTSHIPRMLDRSVG